MITQLGRWTQDAACARADRDPRWWDPEAGTPDQLTLAATICSECPVRYECAEDAEADPPAGAQIRAGRVYGYGGAAGENPPTVAKWLSGPIIRLRACDICGQEFEPASPRHVYCSPTCRSAARPGRRPVQNGTIPVERICAAPTCERRFTPVNHQALYCTPACKAVVKRHRERARAQTRRSAA